MIKKLKIIITEHIYENSVKYFFLVLCFITGVAAGAFFVKSLPAERSDELMAIISGFCTGISDGEIRAWETFCQSIANNLRTVIILYVCAMSYYLFPLIYLHMAARGFVIGFTVGFMSLFFGGKGFLFVLVSVLPQSIVLLPTTLAMSVLAHNHCVFKKKVVKNSFLKYDKRNELLKFTYYVFLICVFMAISALIDSFVIPVFVTSISVLF